MRSLLLAPLLLLGGCYLADPCYGVACLPCVPALTIVVGDATTGGSVPGLDVSGAEVICEETTSTVCTTTDAGPGTYSLTLTAPGYLAEEVAVEVPSVDTSASCCGCPHVGQRVTVELEPE